MKILLFGADGQVGWELQRSLSPLGTVDALGHREADLVQSVQERIERARPQVIVNAAAYTAVDRAESEPELALRVNAGAVGEMAAAAARLGALLVHYSTDYVFDGGKSGPYREDDPTGPLNVYGRTKLAGEEAIRAVPGCEHLILRTSWVYALRGRNFARTILQRARTLDRLQVVADTQGVPTSAELIADVTALALLRLRDRAPGRAARLGTFHLVPAGATTWHGYALYLVEQARQAGMPLRVAPDQIIAVPASTFAAPARRPLNSRLDNGRLCERFGLVAPDWRLHVRRVVDALAREKGE
jgi:dTDP-4-dehydrorhamnose reductase